MAEAEAETARSGENRWSVPLIILAMLAFALQDVAVKLVASDVSIWQMQVVRSIAVLAMLWLVVASMGRRDELVPNAWRWPILRSLVMTGAYLFFYASLPFLTLAQAGAAFYVGPLLITVFAALLLGEPIGPRRVIAVLVGFVGVLIIVRPGTEGWNPIALAPVAAAACYALGVVMTRWRCRDQPGFALTFTHNIMYSGIGVLGVLLVPLAPLDQAARDAAPFLLEGWAPLGLVAFALMVATAGTHMVGMLASIGAYKGAEASRIAPFEYSYLAMMPVLDLAIWGVAPSLSTLLGMALIVAAGAFVAWREGRPPRPRVQFRAEGPAPDEGEDGDAPLRHGGAGAASMRSEDAGER